MRILLNELRTIIRDVIAESKDDEDEKKYPPEYKAPEGSKRNRDLDAATAAVAKATNAEEREAAYKKRAEMEKAVAEKNEALDLVRELVAEVVSEALSKKTKATLRKKAEKRGLTPGSVEAEYKKGLAAWGTSGSRPGISQHAWAMARVNAATPSKSWATVKKSKSKKKKKKK